MGLLQESRVAQPDHLPPFFPESNFWFEPPDPNVLLQSKTTELQLTNGQNEINLSIGVETAPAYGIEDRLNEDCPMIIPMGKGRLLVAVHDGASSRKPVYGLAALGVKGSYYVSHLVSLRFSLSDECQELSECPDITAGDVMRKVNGWLNQELSKVPGVNYGDVLSIPGMSATYALIDAPKNEITIAHVADTIAVIQKPDKQIEILTFDQNCRFDDETLALVKCIARENNCTPLEVVNNEQLYKPVKDQLARTFIEKINTPNGCGILNGQPELLTNGLIYENKTYITPGSVLVMASDGMTDSYQGEGLCELEVVELFMKDVNQIRIGESFQMTRINSEHFLNDPHLIKHPRLINDDRTIIRVEIT